MSYVIVHSLPFTAVVPFAAAVLSCAVLCCAVLCCAVLCCAVLRCAELCCAVHKTLLCQAKKGLNLRLIGGLKPFKLCSTLAVCSALVTKSGTAACTPAGLHLLHVRLLCTYMLIMFHTTAVTQASIGVSKDSCGEAVSLLQEEQAGEIQAKDSQAAYAV